LVVVGPPVKSLKEKASSYLLAILDVIEDAEKGASRPGVGVLTLKNVPKGFKYYKRVINALDMVEVKWCD
jgi:hypothetical protein